MMRSHIDITMGARDYGELKTSKAKSVLESTKPLHIEQPSVESIPRIPKIPAKRSVINPNAMIAQNYLTVEDLAQCPYAVSTLDVLQSCPAQRSALLSALGIVDQNNFLMLTFDMLNVKKRLPHHMDFQIKSTYRNINIFGTVIDEGASTCVMPISCWKAIGSPSDVPSPTLLTPFDEHSHRSHEIILAFPIYVGGKVVNIEVEIIDGNLYYNLLFSKNWIYKMDAIVSSLFYILCFPHEGRIIRVDYLHYSPCDSHATLDSIVPLVENPHNPIENLGVGMYSFLMGIFNLHASTAIINVISSSRRPS